ncbi:hypothetical protein BHE74_00038384 [Ensete ventricosum]|nr:hypothetical protein BHE74_00038384 [Ensete ventricosum]
MREWTLFLDGSTNTERGEAGLVLKGPDDQLCERVLYFESKATNNEAEYEALLFGLCLALKLNVKELRAFTHCQLVVGHINMDYDGHDPIMVKYLTEVFEKLFYLACDWTNQQLLGTFIEGLKLEIKGEVKARQPYTVATTISFARIQEERLNQDAQRTRTTPRPMTYKPPSIRSCPSLPKKLTREELRDRLTKGLCWHCDEPRSHDHHCKKGHLLLIEPLEDVEEETQEHKEEVTDEEE